jgi:hypothetical protein
MLRIGKHFIAQRSTLSQITLGCHSRRFQILCVAGVVTRRTGPRKRVYFAFTVAWSSTIVHIVPNYQ